MSAEIVSIVDSTNSVIGAMPRNEMRGQSVIYQVTYILVFNTGGDLLVQRRTDIKDVYPGLLDFAAGGVVLAEESYEESAARELEEELGISVPLTRHFDIWFEDTTCSPANRNWGRVFSCVHDGPFSLQPSEVVSVEILPADKALAIDPGQVTPDSRQVLIAWLGSDQNKCE
jgi:8-oxo-dGTP pyrophosphatase MutT (NUDIX family)